MAKYILVSTLLKAKINKRDTIRFHGHAHVAAVCCYDILGGYLGI